MQRQPLRTLVTGSGGLLGFALKQAAPDFIYVTSRDADLRDLVQVKRLFEKVRPDRVIHLAAQVGGVKKNLEANADLFTNNVQINTNVLTVAQASGVSRLISILSACAFPESGQPLNESMLHDGMPFEGNLGYAYAKRMLDIQTKLLWKQYGCRFSTLTPVTMYGPNDNFDLENGHVVGALINKCHVAQEEKKPLEVWGSGQAVRQFVFSSDVARLILEDLERFDSPDSTIVAADAGISIRSLVEHIVHATGFKGDIVFNSSKPEGQRVRVLKSAHFESRFPRFQFASLKDGLAATNYWFSENRVLI